MVKVRFIGTGDAFGSGGRFNTCFMVELEHDAFLIDCGASSLVAMRRLGIEPNSISTIFVSHLHGDHFGGLPFFILDAQFYSRRRSPLTLVGPSGFAERLRDAMELFFPGSADAKRKYEIVVSEVSPGETLTIAGVTLSTVEVAHACGAPALALRLVCEGRTIAYSGDTEWTDALLEVGRNADLFIAEALSFDTRITQHLDYFSLRANEARINAKRIVLTHLGPEMLQRQDEVEHEIATDGLILEI